MRPVELQIGDEYGRLTVLRLLMINGRRSWECRCQCGAVLLASASNLVRGVTVSCGCRKKDHLVAMNTTHGLSASLEYKAWENMIIRCENKKAPYYRYYGGRGSKSAIGGGIRLERF